MKKVLGMMVAIGSLTLASMAVAADVEKGKEAYKTAKCGMCHSIAGTGGKMKALDGVGGKLKADEIKKWVVSPAEMNKETKKKPVKVAEADLANIVAYLQTLK
jgi:cytochrome c2